MTVEANASIETHLHASKHAQDATSWRYVCNLLAHRLHLFLMQGIRDMSKIKALLQHNFNSLHIYCRLVGLGMAREQARHLAARIEKLYLYSKVLYR
jgi:hypothetical protein